MSFPNTLPFPVGYRDPGSYNGILGVLYQVNGRLYRVVKAGAAFAAGSSGLFVATAKTNGVPTWVVTVNGTVKNPDVCGVIPAVAQDGTTSVNSAAFSLNDIFLLQVGGPTQVQVASSNVINTAANGAALMADTNGLAALIASSIEGGAPIFYADYATNTTAATSGTLRTVILEGLL